MKAFQKFKVLPVAASILSVMSLSNNVMASDGHDHHEHRQHDAHVHGHAVLNVAQEDKEVELSFEIPAMDLVGFEHAPETQAQKDKVAHFAELLKHGERVVAFSKAAGCALESAKVESALIDDHADHEGHDHDKHDDHGHEDHGHEKHDDHGHDDHKDHDHDEHKETHSEFELTYHFECNNPSELSELQVKLFEHAPTLEEVEVNWFGEQSVKKSELSPKQAKMSLAD